MIENAVKTKNDNKKIMVQMARQKEMREILTFITAARLALLWFRLPLFFYSQSLLIIHFELDSYKLKALGNMKGLFHPQGSWHEGLFLVAVDRCLAAAFLPTSFREHYSVGTSRSARSKNRYPQPVPGSFPSSTHGIVPTTLAL